MVMERVTAFGSECGERGKEKDQLTKWQDAALVSLDLGFLLGVISKIKEFVLLVCVARTQAGCTMNTFLQVCVLTRS